MPVGRGVARSVGSSLRSALRAARHAIIYESRAGRAAEIAGWSNALTAVLAGAGALYATRGVALSATVLVATFVALRVALAHRWTVWVAAALGTVAVGTAFGALAWLFAQLLETPSAPTTAAILCAVGSAVLPASAYARVARLRADEAPDSLVRKPSTPPSFR